MDKKTERFGYTVGPSIPADDLQGIVSDELYSQMTTQKPFEPIKATAASIDEDGATAAIDYGRQAAVCVSKVDGMDCYTFNPGSWAEISFSKNRTVMIVCRSTPERKAGTMTDQDRWELQDVLRKALAQSHGEWKGDSWEASNALTALLEHFEIRRR